MTYYMSLWFSCRLINIQHHINCGHVAGNLPIPDLHKRFFQKRRTRRKPTGHEQVVRLGNWNPYSGPINTVHKRSLRKTWVKPSENDHGPVISRSPAYGTESFGHRTSIKLPMLSTIRALW